MKLVVGLGNPGKRYAETRHNVGFQVLAELARRHGDGKPKAKFHGEIVEATMAGQRVLLLCPHTYMNKSGTSVGAACDFYQLELNDLLVVCDDFNLPLAKLRFRAKGSAGGQKGMDDVLRRLGSQHVARLRIGIGPPAEAWDVADYVLSRFSQQEKETINDAILRAADAVAYWTAHTIEDCMNNYNADPDD